MTPSDRAAAEAAWSQFKKDYMPVKGGGPPITTKFVFMTVWDIALREGARRISNLSSQEIQLHAGELTASEMRAVKAVLAWVAREITDSEDGPAK